jgi:hypothetical protein
LPEYDKTVDFQELLSYFILTIQVIYSDFLISHRVLLV